MPTIDALRDLLWARHQGLCGFCGESVGRKEMHIDHITPRGLGGTDDLANLRIAHRHCNISAGRDVSKARRAMDPVELARLGVASDPDIAAITLRFPASLRKRALGVAQDEDRTFASLVIYALRRYVTERERDQSGA